MRTILAACLFTFFLANAAFAQTSSPAIDAASSAGGPQTADRSKQQDAQHAARLKWRPWSDAVFADAKREKRFVLLDLEAVWCHWCHVMDANTYSDPAVIKLLESRYITVKADQDSRPDLSNRYEDYGWPATVVFDAEGHEIVKRQGYLAPDEMASMLQAIIDDPTPGPSVEAEAKLELPSSPLLTDGLRAQLKNNYLAGYDVAQGNWGTNQKYLDWDSVEYSMTLARLTGDGQAEHMARQTLTEQLHLLDPAWGGVYQYSMGSDWNSPHFEKIMQMQAENLRIYAAAYAVWKDPNYLQSARQIRDYMRNFLTSPEGAFYTSQDADLLPGEHSAKYFALNDSGRRQRGIPRVDQHIYARENGWAIDALANLYAVTGDNADLNDAVRAGEWIIARRSLPGGGFRHGESSVDGPYLGDNVYMARAFLMLYQATADRRWLQRAEETAQFTNEHFKSKVGYVAVAKTLDSKLAPRPQTDENVAFARITNLLHHYTGNAQDRACAEHAMRYLTAPAVAKSRGFQVGGILLADRELNAPPLHITVVGSKQDAAARALFASALFQSATYKRVEWWDTNEGPLPNPDVEYPQFGKPAAFVCTDRRCSAPIFDGAKINAFAKSARRTADQP
jgi:uncharacterized protein YyaL (SSP411 family)